MGTIAKVHTFTQGVAFDASAVNRNFDDLYTLVNGNIDSANIASTFTLAASAVTITDTASNYTATEMEAILIEINERLSSTLPPLTRGFNSIHVLTQRSHGIVVLPGKIEINDQPYSITTRINITAVSLISGSFSAEALYGLAIHTTASTAVITASDFFLIPYADTSATSGMDEAKNGYYFSSNYRVIHVLANLASASDAQVLFHHQTLGEYNKSMRLKLTTSEAGFHGFDSAGGAAPSLPGGAEIIVKHDAELDAYGYLIRGTHSGSSGFATFQLPAVFGFSANAVGAMAYYMTYNAYQSTQYITMQTNVSSTGAFQTFPGLVPAAANFYDGPVLNLASRDNLDSYIVDLKKNIFLGFKPS